MSFTVVCPLKAACILKNKEGFVIKVSDNLNTARQLLKRKQNNMRLQKPIGVCEYIAYALLFCLLVMIGAMPVCAIILLPIVLPLLYLLYRRFDALLPFSVIAAYGVTALIVNYDILTVIYVCFLLAALSGLIVSVNLAKYLVCVTVAAICGICGGVLGMSVVRLAEGVSLERIAETYILRESEDPLLSFAAKRIYERDELDTVKLAVDDPDYAQAATAFFAARSGEDLSKNAAYYCVHFCGVFAITAYIIAAMINCRTVSAFDSRSAPLCVAESTQALGGIATPQTRLRDMRVPRAFLWSFVLPAFFVSMILELVGGYAPISSLLMHGFVTIPSAFAAVTLMLYFFSYAKGKSRIAAGVVCGIIGVAMVYVPMVLFICSVFGLCDCLLNLRFWTEFIKS